MILDGSPPWDDQRVPNNAFRRLIAQIRSLGTAAAKLAGVWVSVLRVDELQVDTTGADAIAGTATLVAGTVTVNTSKVRTGSLIHLTGVGTANAGHLTIGAIVNNTSFVITSTSGTDVRVVHWSIRNPQV